VAYDIRPRDEALIRSAIALGDWILAQPATNRKQKKATEALLKQLRGLPAGNTDGRTIEYGFHIRQDPLAGGGIYRAWRVSLGPSGLELFSVYSPDAPIDIEEKGLHELNLWIRPDRPNDHDGYYYDEWIAEVSNPGQFQARDTLFGIHAEILD
jgi:hypothetical protein